MTASLATEWLRETLLQAVIVAGPPMGAAVVLGVLVAVLQAATQINDSAVAFAPKAIGVVVATLVAGAWMLGRIEEFARAVLVAVGQVGG
jgi:flagellar biosynthesis protein FliQ